jgi:hypothetical protein
MANSTLFRVDSQGPKYAVQQRPAHCSKCQAKNPSFDHLVRGYEECIGHGESEALRCLNVYDETVDRWLLKRQIARFLAAQNTINVGG